MRLPVRWPLHPAPIDGEALSSWLRRVAASYQMGVSALLEHDLGDERVSDHDLDLAPPPALVDIMIKRSGLDPNRLHQMSLAGWTPWLHDNLQPHTGMFDTYVREFSVMIKPGRQSNQAPEPWQPWMADHPIQRACPMCLDDPARQGLLLMWQLPLLVSCPDHGCLLEPYVGFPGEYLAWTGADSLPRAASGAVMAMDHRTQEALATGRVSLRGRSVHAGVWFRLLRTLIDELSTPVSFWPSGAANLRLAWESCGHPLRAGQGNWRPFEAFTWPVQTQLLEATAHTIGLLETGDIIGPGRQAELFVATLPVGVDDGKPRPNARPENDEDNPWKRVKAALDEAVQAARDHPAQAQSLYNLIVHGCRTPREREQLQATFTDLGIPTENLVLQQHDDTVRVT